MQRVCFQTKSFTLWFVLFVFLQPEMLDRYVSRGLVLPRLLLQNLGKAMVDASTYFKSSLFVRNRKARTAAEFPSRQLLATMKK